MQFHAHTIARDISENGTASRRYESLKLVEVPEDVKAGWLAYIALFVALNPLLARLEAMSHNGPLYACLKCTHFVEGQKLILE